MRKFQFELEDLCLVLLLSKLEAGVSVMSAEPDVEAFVGLKFLGEVLLLRNEVLMRLEIFVYVLLRSPFDDD